MHFRKIQSKLGGWILSIGRTNFTGGSMAEDTARVECQTGNGPGLHNTNTKKVMQLGFQNSHYSHHDTAIGKWNGVMDECGHHSMSILGISEINANLNYDTNNTV